MRRDCALLPSKTTLLGLLKHVTYVEGVWFDQAISGQSYAEIGIASTPDHSFTLRNTDTIASFEKLIGAVVRCPGGLWPGWRSMPSLTVVETARSGHCSCRCYASSRSMPGMPTFSVSRSWPDALIDRQNPPPSRPART
jgi:hypothetical protein